MTDPESLLEEFDLTLVSRGPTAEGWTGRFYKCPLCGCYADRTKYDQCDCGNIRIDKDAGRISISRCDESDVEVFEAVRKTR